MALSKRMRLPKTLEYLDLESIRTAREEVVVLEAKLTEKKKALREMEGTAIAILEHGGYCRGPLTATLDTVTKAGKRSPKWKGLYATHLQTIHDLTEEQVKERFQGIVDSMEPNVTKSTNLVISEKEG